ncbi:hypothetical protein OIU77_021012 [Salix suchowensis]|uniref:Uncharacterized protein n=1 Tax=Salix suchowensis TaxID=1278906 RepID=A0ABQ9C8F4_9ROSI|nr:organ-specific protein [Salix suchowensis]KAJ6395870.1 hypothetical protein OIU77_021012 [Salix suchowensis]
MAGISQGLRSLSTIQSRSSKIKAKMKSFLAVLVLFSFLSFVELSDARKEPREYYWKSMMKDEPMPEAIKELFVEDPAGAGKLNHFVKDFDTRHSAIIYHSHAEKDRLKERKSTNARDHDGDAQ